MEKNLKELSPRRVWEKFYEITRVPRPSHHEDAIREYLLAEAHTHGIEAEADAAGNVIMRKAATPGMESRKGIVLQAHMDMVPQKNGDKAFDFVRDPIEAYVDGEWVKADGTTLGADNGMGMAAILAVLESDDIEHGPIEALITATEETGMVGANGLKGGMLRGDILVNLDSETEGELYVGCAGGLDASMTFSYEEESVPASSTAFLVEVKGLKGGHSGIEIVLERGNANLVLFRLLKMAEKAFGLRLSSVDGGGLRNAIPREARAVVTVPAAETGAFREAVRDFERTVREELRGVDEGVSVTAEETALPASLIDTDTQRRLIRAVHGCPNGVVRMSPSMKGLVQTSTNLARVVSSGGRITVQCLLRSSVGSEKRDLGERIASVFELAGAEVVLSGAYDGWNPDMDSPILAAMVASYERLFGRRPAVTAIHAGLECGIIRTNYPHLDMISFGPTICYPHSPDEKVSIPSVERFWNYLLETLRSAPEK